MGIRIGIGSLKIGQGSTGVDWSSYWATLISATVENAAPTDVVLTFPTAQTSLLATDITCTVNGVARTVSSASWTGAVWTVVLASAVEYADVVVMTFVPSGGTKTVTNNVLTYAALLTSTGTGAGVSTLVMQVSANITVTLGANAKFYSDAGGTADESATWIITSGALRTIYLKCTTGTATMTFSDTSKITKFGDSATNGWVSLLNAAKLTITIGKLPLIDLRVSGQCVLIGALPVNLTSVVLFTHVNGFVEWQYTGALPSGITGYAYLSGSIAWVYAGALPIGITKPYFNSALMNFTGLDMSGTGNITELNMLNFRISKMSSADMVTLLTSLTNRVGSLPAIITINDYADYASPPAEVVTAVNTLKATKGITIVNLGA